MDGDFRTAFVRAPGVLRRHPALVLWTTKDPTGDVSVGEKIANLIPGAEFVVLDDCGHWPQFEDPARFNQLQLEFLRRTGPVQ